MQNTSQIAIVSTILNKRAGLLSCVIYLPAWAAACSDVIPLSCTAALGSARLLSSSRTTST